MGCPLKLVGKKEVFHEKNHSTTDIRGGSIYIIYLVCVCLYRYILLDIQSVLKGITDIFSDFGGMVGFHYTNYEHLLNWNVRKNYCFWNVKNGLNKERGKCYQYS